MDKMMKSTVAGAAMGVLMLSAITAAPAQQPSMMQGQMEDLSSLPSGQQVAALRYCDNVFHVRTSEGDSLEFAEFNLRFKVDGSDKGPPPGKPALISAGMMGDRAFIIFADPAEISAFIANEC